MIAKSIGNRANFAVEVSEIDVNDLNRDEERSLPQLLKTYKVIILRNQNVIPESHIKLVKLFGSVRHHVLDQYKLPSYPEIMLISNKKIDGNPIGIPDAGREWHSDMSFTADPPYMTLLSAVELPKSGSCTSYSDMTAVIDDIDANLFAQIASLRARFSYIHAYNEKRKKNPSRPPLTAAQLQQLEDVIHPIVRYYDDVKQKALFVNPSHTVEIVGLDSSQSQSILGKLFGISTNDKYVYRHNWKDGDMVLWDNRRTMHRAEPYNSQEIRHMFRSTIAQN